MNSYYYFLVGARWLLLCAALPRAVECSCLSHVTFVVRPRPLGPLSPAAFVEDYAASAFPTAMPSAQVILTAVVAADGPALPPGLSGVFSFVREGALSYLTDRFSGLGDLHDLSSEQIASGLVQFLISQLVGASGDGARVQQVAQVPVCTRVDCSAFCWRVPRLKGEE